MGGGDRELPVQVDKQETLLPVQGRWGLEPKVVSHLHAPCCDVCLPGLTHEHTQPHSDYTHTYMHITCTHSICIRVNNYLTIYIETYSRSVEELQLKLTKANENASFLQKSIGEVTLKAEQSQQEAAKKHEEEKKELEEKLLELVRRHKGDCW